jgi:Tfp pilus assembly protein PilF
MAYLAKGESRRALVDFDNVIRLDPTQPTAYSERAKAYRELRDDVSADRDDDKARELLEKQKSRFLISSTRCD